VTAGEIKVVRLAGDVDVETRAATRAMLAELGGARRAIVDLTHVDYIDSAGVTELMLAHNARRAAGAEPIRLVAPPGTNVARLLELSGLVDLFTVHASLADAEARG
jgi:anti-sigma B factor antagonist